MDSYTQHTASPALSQESLVPTQPSSASKRPHAPVSNDSYASKRVKINTEEPSLYSENVRRKLASTTRTGQACDRCKERKMKCDPDPIACQPCRQKNLKCYTTDRVSGQSRERGQTDRAEYEMEHLRDQLALYQRHYGLLQDVSATPRSVPGTSPIPERQTFAESGDLAHGSRDLPSSQYVGWTGPTEHDNVHKGPVQGTQVDTIDWGVIDSGAFECEMTREPMNDDMDVFNFSVSSVLKTIHQRQRIHRQDLQLPGKEEALQKADLFLSVMWAYYPVVHQGTFRELVNRLYDAPLSVSVFEEIQIVQMLSVLKHQEAIRNQKSAASIKDCYRYLHYSLGHFPDILKSDKLSALQAMCMILLQFRNMPKPGYTWPLAQQMLIKCIDLEYHRDPDKIELLPEQQNPLAKELRKRVFHAIIGVCIATGCRMGRPAPWQFVQWDVPLPIPLLDSEISIYGIKAERSGRCAFWAAIQLSKLLPLYTELHNYVLSVRREVTDYLQIVDALKAKIDAWRAEWDVLTENEENNYHLQIQALLVDHWAAEFILNLYHPKVCPIQGPEIVEKNLNVCQKAAKRMLTGFHTLSRNYKGADFTWHSIVAYTLGFSLTLHINRRRKGMLMTQEQFDAIKNEFAGWLSLCNYADLVLSTDQLLVRRFTPLAEQVIKELCHSVHSPSTQQGSSVNGLSLRGSMSQRPSLDFTSSAASSQLQTSSPISAGMQSQHPFSPLIKQEQYIDQSHSYGSPSYGMPTSMPSSSYGMYPPVTTFAPHLPTSLAPLLNETPPNSMVQYQHYQHPSISVQDPAMQFQPALYTGVDAVWPLVPNDS